MRFMKPHQEAPVQLFGKRYHPCPNHPTGTVWQVSMRSRYGSSSWNMNSFQACIKYLRDQYAHDVARTKSRRNPGDEYCEREFWGYVQGPGGMMDWDTVEALVKHW